MGTPLPTWRRELVTARRIATVVLVTMTATCLSAAAHAADLKVVASGAIKLAFEQLIPVFKQSSGHTVSVRYSPAGALLGPLPAQIQQVTLLTADIPATSKATGAASAFIGFLAGATAAATLKANGFQPADGR